MWINGTMDKYSVIWLYGVVLQSNVKKRAVYNRGKSYNHDIEMHEARHQRGILCDCICVLVKTGSIDQQNGSRSNGGAQTGSWEVMRWVSGLLEMVWHLVLMVVHSGSCWYTFVESCT